MTEQGECINFKAIEGTGYCREAKVRVICDGFKDVCPFPELYKEALNTANSPQLEPAPFTPPRIEIRPQGMMTSEARKMRRERQLEQPSFAPAVNTFKVPYS